MIDLGTEEKKKQAEKIIDQAYLMGYKAGRENTLEVESDKLIERGRNEAWEAAKKIISQNGASWGMKDLEAIFGLSYSTDIMLDLSASEAIEKIRVYEERKKQEEDEIKVGDEVVYYNDSEVKFIVTRIKNGYIFGINDTGEFSNKNESCWVKTGRHFDEIAEVLKKLRGDAE